MELSLAITMKFWTDGKESSDRIKNVKYTWDRLKHLSEFLKKKWNKNRG